MIHISRLWGGDPVVNNNKGGSICEINQILNPCTVKQRHRGSSEEIYLIIGLVNCRIIKLKLSNKQVASGLFFLY